MPELSTSFHSALDSLYNFKLPKVASGHGPYPKLNANVTFHDKHMDPRLALHKVILAPSLVNDLVKAGERALQTYKDRTDVELPPVIDDTLSPLNSYRKVVDAGTVALVYSSAFAEPATTIASMLLLHPNAPNWSNSMFFLEEDPTKEKSDALNEDFTPVLRRHYDEAEDYKSVDKDAWESMDDPTKKLFQMAYEKFKRPAVWHIYFVRREARRALKRMGAVVSRNMSTYPTFRTDAPKIGPGSLDLPFSPDALETAWGMSLPAFTSAALKTSAGSRPLRRSRRLAAGKAKAFERQPVARKEAVPSVSRADSIQPDREWSKVTSSIPSESIKTDEEVATSLLHRAWARAVEKDATFIVLHCGTYERIAIRHRSSQTLFLSDLINVTQCSDPAYGAIHIGLFISILSDVLDRVAQIEEQANQTSKKRRRSALSTIEPRKRPRTRTTVTSEATRIITEQKQLQIMADEIPSRPLALLRMQYDKFNSPVPASFLRHNLIPKRDKSTYAATEYFILTLTSFIGDGSTGDVHGALIEFLGMDGIVHSFHNIVVKFAFHPAQRRRLRHEFKVYEKLKLSGITCVPHILGLFEDIEGNTLALVMTHAGKSLADRRPDLQTAAFHVSKLERDNFVEALRSIHAQGFRHRDIRPENLLVADDGSVKIIDFDRASVESSEQTREREMKHLINVLDGHDYWAVGVGGVSHGSFCSSSNPTTSSRGWGWEDSADNSDATETEGQSTELSDEE